MEEVCGQLGVDPELVDIGLVHRLTKEVAHRGERPMAPVTSYILGLAVGRGDGTPEALTERLLEMLPPEADERG